MTFDEWIAQIRDVAHTGDEIATLHFARALRFAPQDKALHERWQDVRAYAACLDLDAVARVMAGHGWRLNRADGGAPSRTVTSPDGQTFRLSPARYLAAWVDEVPRPDESMRGADLSVSAAWWEAAGKGQIYVSERAAYRLIWNVGFVDASIEDANVLSEQAEARIQHRALVQYLRARLWMEP